MATEDEIGVCRLPAVTAIILLSCSLIVTVSLGLVAYYRRKMYDMKRNGTGAVTPDQVTNMRRVTSQGRASQAVKESLKKSSETDSMKKEKSVKNELLRKPSSRRLSFLGLSRRQLSINGQKNEAEKGEDDGTYRETVVHLPLGRDGTEAKKDKHIWEISFKEVKVMKQIGRGSFGDVYKGMWCGTTVAIKIPKSNIPPDLVEAFKDEITLMTELHHPNIVIFMAACIDEQKKCLVLEYLANGNMADFLKDTTKKINLHLLHRFAMDIARGMKYLHRRCGLIQRDLKSRNLLIDDSMNVKLCDFGLSRFIDSNEELTHAGTPYWTAPEVIRREEYDEKSDVYSFSIVLWELITRDEPYDGMPGMDAAHAVAELGLRPKIPIFCPDEYRTMMVECWDGNPSKRPGFDEILDRLFAIKKAHSRNPSIVSRSASVKSCRATNSKSNPTITEEEKKLPLPGSVPVSPVRADGAVQKTATKLPIIFTRNST